MVAGRRRDDAPGQSLGGKANHLVVSSSELERKHRLLVLSLQPNAVAEAAGQCGREVKRRLRCCLIHSRKKNALEIGVQHRFV
jgi:hypothetical protein